VTRDGYGQAYQRGFELTVRFLLSRGVQRDDAREVAQAAWVRGWERIRQLREDSSVVTWINTIALNVHRGLLRRVPLNLTSLDVRDKTVVIDLATIDVAHILQFCRPQYRVLLEQSLSGASMAEIASQHGVSETAIRIRLLRARRHARGRMERRTVNAAKSSLPVLEQPDAA
jgi:DNA-directed RNA polymerase specialized sigma24 family protein